MLRRKLNSTLAVSLTIAAAISSLTVSKAANASFVPQDESSSIPAISTGRIADLLNIDLGNIGNLGDILGKMGIPDLDRLIADVLSEISKAGDGDPGVNSTPGAPPTNGGSNPAGSLPPEGLNGASGSITPGVNPTIAANLDAVGILTESITAIGLSDAGQNATKTRLEGAQIGADKSREFVTQSREALATQAQTAAQVIASINSQTSTQDVLKTAMSGLVSLQVATSSQMAYGLQQDAIDSQLQLLDLYFTRESRDGTYANGKNLQLINQQLNQNIQRDIAEASSATQDTSRALRLIHVLR